MTAVRPAGGPRGTSVTIAAPGFSKATAIWLRVGYVVLGQIDDANHRCGSRWERHSCSYRYGADSGWRIEEKLR
jgi:hypothetical protein